MNLVFFFFFLVHIKSNNKTHCLGPYMKTPRSSLQGIDAWSFLLQHWFLVGQISPLDILSQMYLNCGTKDGEATSHSLRRRYRGFIPFGNEENQTWLGFGTNFTLPVVECLNTCYNKHIRMLWCLNPTTSSTNGPVIV